jgi:hypothetical protein
LGCRKDSPSPTVVHHESGSPWGAALLHIQWLGRRLWYMVMTYGVAQRGRCLPVVAAQAAAWPTIAALPHREGGTSTESCPWRQYAVGGGRGAPATFIAGATRWAQLRVAAHVSHMWRRNVHAADGTARRRRPLLAAARSLTDTGLGDEAAGQRWPSWSAARRPQGRCHLRGSCH